MKKILVLLAFVSALISCKKDEDDPQPAGSTFSFKVNNGATLYAESGKMEYDNGTSRYQINAVKGTSGTANYYAVTLAPNNTAVGTYQVTAQSQTGSYIQIADMNDVGTFSQGTITITEKTSSKISGNFTATGGSHPTITSISGSFTNVPIY
jgi:hypothetical protein